MTNVTGIEHLGPAYPYRVLDVDGGVEHVASFYGVDETAIFHASVRRAPWARFARLTPREFFDAVRAGVPGSPPLPEQTIVVPVPEAARRWPYMMVALGADTTLDALCRVHNASSLRIAAVMDGVTPVSLFRLFANRAVREEILARHHPPPADLEQRLGSVALREGTRIFIPYPPTVEGLPIAAPPRPQPNTEGAVGSFTSSPRAVRDMVRDHIVPLREKIARLEGRNNDAARHARYGAGLTLGLAAIRQVIARADDEHDISYPSTHALDRAVAALQDRAAEVLVVEPVRYERPAEHADRVALAEDVLSGLHTPTLLRILGDVFQPGKDVDVNGGSLHAQVCELFLWGYQTLARSPQIEAARRDVDAALGVPSVGPPSEVPDPGPTPLDAMVRLCADTTGMFTATVGSLPGPASLVGALVEISIATTLPSIFRAGETAPALLAKYRDWIMKLSGYSAQKIAAFEEGVILARSADEVRAHVRPLVEACNGRLMTSARWNGVMTVITLFALIAACNGDGNLPQKLVNITSAGLTTGTAAVELLKGLGVGGRFATLTSARLMNGIGDFVAVLTVVSGAFTFLEGLVDGDDALMHSGLWGMGGGMVVLAGVAFSIPGLQGVGIAIAFVASAYDALEAGAVLGKGPVARAFRAQLVAFRDGSMMSSVGEAQMRVGPHPWSGDQSGAWTRLLAAITECDRAIDAADAHLRGLRRTPRNARFLVRLGFDAKVGPLLIEDDTDELERYVHHRPETA